MLTYITIYAVAVGAMVWPIHAPSKSRSKLDRIHFVTVGRFGFNFYRRKSNV